MRACPLNRHCLLLLRLPSRRTISTLPGTARKPPRPCAKNSPPPIPPSGSGSLRGSCGKPASMKRGSSSLCPKLPRRFPSSLRCWGAGGGFGNTSSVPRMNWEESSACTPLKRDLLRAWFAEDQRFFLTGGSALGLFHLHHRLSFDLDLFTHQEIDGHELQNQVLRVAAQIGAECQAIRSAPDFHRFRLTRGDERELLDLVVDRAPQLDAEKPTIDGIRVDTLREMIANKLTTLLSRTEMKDVVDLYFLEQAGHDLLAALPDAQAKDGGWEPAVVSMLLDGLQTTELPPWLLRSVSSEDLRAFIHRLRLAIAAKALPPNA